MREQLLKFFSLPLKVKLGAFVGSIVLIVGVYVYAFYLPLSEELTRVQESTDNIMTEMTKRKGLVARLPEARKRVQELDAKLAKVLLELPDEDDIPQLLTRISDKARDAGLEILYFKPLSEVKKDFYAEVPVQIQVSGTFHQVATFFDEVGHMERIVNILNYAFDTPKVIKNDVKLNANITATAFRFLKENERAAGDPNEKRGRN